MPQHKIFSSIDDKLSKTENSQIVSGTNNTFSSVNLQSVSESTVAMTGTEINLANGNCFTDTITSSGKTYTISATSGKSHCFTLILTNGGTGSVTFPNNVFWADGEIPDLTTSGVDVLTFYTPNGANWYCVPSLMDAK